MRQAADIEGKYPQRLSLEKREDASARRFTSNKYLLSQPKLIRPKKERIAHSECEPVVVDSPVAPLITSTEESSQSYFFALKLRSRRIS